MEGGYLKRADENGTETDRGQKGASEVTLTLFKDSVQTSRTEPLFFFLNPEFLN